ncbi:MAG: helix-turn-helix domain-containing protein [Planctomycetes bacterium]|nr:helix-turn-helix domain-containing protein [Planctomycetota bacterium]
MNENLIVNNVNGGLFDMDGASQYLKIKRSTLYQFCMRKQIPVCKIGKLNRFRKKDLDAFISQNLQEAKE